MDRPRPVAATRRPVLTQTGFVLYPLLAIAATLLPLLAPDPKAATTPVSDLHPATSPG